MVSPFHPLMLMAPLLWGGLLVAFANFLRSVPSYSKPQFGFYAVVLISWMDIFALLSGFSIGLFVAGATILIGVLSLLFSRHYRPALIFATAVAFLLLLLLRGWFLPAHYALPLLLTAGLVFVVVLAWRQRDLKSREAADATLAVLAILFFSEYCPQSGA